MSDLRLTQDLPERPADALAAATREAVLQAVQRPPEEVKKTLKLVRRVRARIRETQERAPLRLSVPQTREEVAEALVAQVARTARMFRFREEAHFQEGMASARLFDHVTPVAHSGPPLPGGIQVLPAKADLMLRVQSLYPNAASKDKIHLAQAFEAGAKTHNNLLRPQAIDLNPALAPALALVRQELGHDFIQTLQVHLAGLEDEIQAMMKGIAERGADGILEGQTGFRSEALITALETLTRNMVAGFDQFGRRQLFPLKPVFAQAEKACAKYDKIKNALKDILSGRKPLIAAELTAVLEAIEIHGEARIVIPRFVMNLQERFQRELESGTAEELADHIIENLMTLEIQRLLTRTMVQKTKLAPQAIADQFCMLVWYFLHHLRNSMGAQLIPPLNVDEAGEAAPQGIRLRIMDWNSEAPKVSEENHRLEVIATLLGILNKCLRVMRISRYQRAFLGTLSVS